MATVTVIPPAAGTAGAIAGAAEGAIVGGIAGSELGGLVGNLIDKGIALLNKPSGGDDGRRGGDRQTQGRPTSNVAQNKQVNDAARQAGLSASQRRALGRAVETESRKFGGNLGYRDVLEIAHEIKSWSY